MSLSWIRVNAALLDDPEIREFGKVLYPRLPAFTARAAAAGHLVALWGQLANHQPDGIVTRRDDEQLEEWAQWKGTAGNFAESFRARFVDDNGKVLEWDEYQGAALARREADRQRKENARKRGQPVPELADTPTTLKRIRSTVSVDSLPDSVRTSGRNGTATVKPLPAAKQERSKGESEPRGNVEKPARPTGVITQTATATATPSSVVTRFTARFYSRSTPERRTEIAKQMAGAMLSTGVEWKGEAVKAIDAEHLDEACLSVMEDPPRESSEAWSAVLAQIKATELEALSARAKAAAGSPRAPLPAGMAGDAPAGATPLRGAIANVLEGLTEEAE